MDRPIIVFIIIGIISFIFFQWRTKTASFFRLGLNADKRFHNSKLVAVLLGLNDQAVEELLNLYKREFGKGPARYARKTIHKWKTGKVLPATQTYERFLVHLPRVMSYDLKCDVLRQFMEEYAAKDDYQLEVFTNDWEEKLEPFVRQIINRAFTTQLPFEVERKLQWLGENDMKAAQQILRRSQAEEGKIMISMLRQEFGTIEKILNEEHLKPKVTHVLVFPFGTIELNIKRR